MSSDLKIQANQANAQLSTGPKTQEGKDISSRNSTTHGLTASTVLLPGEDPAAYEILAKGMLQDSEAINVTETALVLELIDIQWRLRRASAYEARVLSAETPDIKALNGMSLIAARLKRQFSATLKEFQQMHEVNKKCRHEELEDAAIVHQADQLLHRPSTVAELGFDFSLEYLDAAISIDESVKAAKEVVENYKYGLDENGELLEEPSEDDLIAAQAELDDLEDAA